MGEAIICGGPGAWGAGSCARAVVVCTGTWAWGASQGDAAARGWAAAEACPLGCAAGATLLGPPDHPEVAGCVQPGCATGGEAGCACAGPQPELPVADGCCAEGGCTCRASHVACPLMAGGATWCAPLPQADCACGEPQPELLAADSGCVEAGCACEGAQAALLVAGGWCASLPEATGAVEEAGATVAGAPHPEACTAGCGGGG